MANNETKIVITAATSQAEAALKSFTGSFKSMVGVVGGSLSVGAFAGLIKSGIDLQDQLGSLSKQYGISAKELGGLKFAADQNGASLDLVAKAVKELSVNMSATPDKFAKLGITAKDATGALSQIADLVETMPDGMQKTALLAELMGKKVGPELAEFMSQGGASMRQYIERGKDIYKVTDESAAAAKNFKDQMAELSARTTAVGVQFGQILLPGLIETTKAMNELAESGHPVLALWRGLAGMGKVPWDLLFPPENLKKSLTSANQLQELRSELAVIEERLKRTGGHGGLIGKWMYGSAEEQAMQANILRNQIAVLEKHGADLDRKAAAVEQKKTVPKAVTDLLNQEKKAAIEKTDRGNAIVEGLRTDYGNDAAKKQRDLLSPLMSKTDKEYADNVAAVSEKAARAREKIEALNLTKEQSAEMTQKVNDLEREQIKVMDDLRVQVEKNNASWEYGAQVALTTYLDEARNVAKQTESMFTNAFKGMEDALVNFVKTGKLDFRSLADSIISDLIRIQIRQAMATGLTEIKGWFTTPASSNTPTVPIPAKNAKGGVYTSPSLSAFSGGVYSTPQTFAFAKGAGIFAEAGPEAIMPLKRGADGRLGVTVTGGTGGGATVIVNVDASGQSQSGDSDSNLNQLGQKIGTLVRGVLVDEMRPGGLLAGAN